MKREEFLTQLEYLLQDIPEEEKRDALEYYRDYLEEAGAENEESVLQEFGSPERIASMIRMDLIGGLQSGGEFTENGYEDHRFKKVSVPAVRLNKERQGEGKSEGREQEPGYGAGGYQKGSYAEQKNQKTTRRKTSPWLKFLLGAGLFFLAAPVIFASFIGLFSGAFSIFTVLVVLFFVAAVLTLGGFLGGVGLIIFGMTQLAADLWFGIMCLGIGLVFLGGGCFLVIFSYLFYGRLLPWIIRSFAGLFGRLTGERREKKRTEDGDKHIEV